METNETPLDPPLLQTMYLAYGYSPVSPHQVGHCDVSLTMPEANISLNSNHRNSHIIKPSCDPDVPECNGANRIVRNPVSSNKMSLHDFNNTNNQIDKISADIIR